MKRVLPYLAYGFVVGMSAFGHWRIAVAADHDEAARCVVAWETRGDIRAAIASAATVPVESLIAIVPNADPERIAAYRDEATRRIQEATGELADPDCSLSEAKERLR